MVVDITLIIVGLMTTIVLAFASHNAKSKAVRVMFWLSLCGTVAIIIISGIGSISTNRKLIELESKTKPRSLSPAQKESITSDLKAITERQKIFIIASILDAEALKFAEDIESVFVGAGFEVVFPKEMVDEAAIMVDPPGLHMSAVKDPKIPFPFVVKIQRIFVKFGIDIPALKSSEPGFAPNKIEILVGQK
jgi:hypothetical protein